MPGPIYYLGHALNLPLERINSLLNASWRTPINPLVSHAHLDGHALFFLSFTHCLLALFFLFGHTLLPSFTYSFLSFTCCFSSLDTHSFFIIYILILFYLLTLFFPSLPYCFFYHLLAVFPLWPRTRFPSFTYFTYLLYFFHHYLTVFHHLLTFFLSGHALFSYHLLTVCWHYFPSFSYHFLTVW